MTDYGTQEIANVLLPLPSPGTNSLLQDADPALYYAIDFWKAMIINYCGARLVNAAAVASPNLAWSSAVVQSYPYDPTPYLSDVQFQMPLLAAWRQTVDSEFRVASFEHDKSVFGILYMLPPLSAAQAELLAPVLSAVYKTLRKLTTQRWDPSYTPPGGSANQPGPFDAPFANLEYIDLRKGQFGRLPAGGNLWFPTLQMECVMGERDNYILGNAQKFAGGDIEVDLVNNDQTTVPNLINASTQQAPTVSSLSVTSGSHNGGTSTTLTGTLFLTGPQVFFGPTAATNVVWNSATSITCTTPAVSGAGTVGVSVLNRDGQSGSLVNAFTFT